MNELDSQRALHNLKAWVQHNPKYAGLEITVDEYSDGTLMDEVNCFYCCSELLHSLIIFRVIKTVASISIWTVRIYSSVRVLCSFFIYVAPSADLSD